MKLVLINGPSGVGKSTVAERLHADLPLSLLVDIDAWRRFLSAYWEQREASLALSYKIAIAAARTSLQSGQSAIVEKVVVDAVDVLDSLIAAGKEFGAEVYEFILTADKATVLARANTRGYKPGSLLTPEKVAELWESSQQLVSLRPRATVIDTSHLTLDETYAKVKELVFKK